MVRPDAEVSERGEHFDGSLYRFRHGVQRWHEGPKGSLRRLADNYVNGNGEILFNACTEALGPSVTTVHTGDIPNYVAAITAKRADQPTRWKVGEQLSDFIARYPCVICGWDKQLNRPEIAGGPNS
jgi:hypothetical protein